MSETVPEILADEAISEGWSGAYGAGCIAVGLVLVGIPLVTTTALAGWLTGLVAGLCAIVPGVLLLRGQGGPALILKQGGFWLRGLPEHETIPYGAVSGYRLHRERLGAIYVEALLVEIDWDAPGIPPGAQPLRSRPDGVTIRTTGMDRTFLEVEAAFAQRLATPPPPPPAMP